jgi:hypothetical protein
VFLGTRAKHWLMSCVTRDTCLQSLSLETGQKLCTNFICNYFQMCPCFIYVATALHSVSKFSCCVVGLELDLYVIDAFRRVIGIVVITSALVRMNELDRYKRRM